MRHYSCLRFGPASFVASRRHRHSLLIFSEVKNKKTLSLRYLYGIRLEVRGRRRVLEARLAEVEAHLA